ncbi:zinc finger CCCH domain-containing protein 13 isoform B [Alligator mississippiensis]|uniref:Zinc finger CCCH domain-containing protein 13 isoform B n=1 Tax=Alligator mississippiensis TaxID=8496 RepID=A0A151MHJ9_ALLMI|nr:zinc finger CCCH domain-containing protein 13 isoform B [Alligator mississippiensis]
MSKIRRKVTVENTKTISDSTSRRPSVFERLGPSTGSTAETQCRNWLKTGNCLYGNTCRFVHGPSPRGKGYSSSYRRSPERPTGDLRERMKNKRQEVETEPQKRNTEESSSPVRKESSRGRHREKEDIKITKERTPESEEENGDWETNREDSDNGDVNYDYDHELSLEMKRQKIQRELMKLEQENMEKREEIVIKKEISPEVVRSKLSPSPSPRKSSKSPKRRSSPKSSSSASKKEKKVSTVSSPLLDQQRSSKNNQSKKKGPRTPSPPPPVQEEAPLGKKHKEKHKAKERLEEKTREGKERGRDFERHKEKKEKQRDPSEGSHRQKRSPSPADHSGSNSSPSREYSPPAARRRQASRAPAKSTTHKHNFSPSRRSASPSGQHHSPISSRHHSSSSQGSEVLRGIDLLGEKREGMIVTELHNRVIDATKGEMNLEEKEKKTEKPERSEIMIKSRVPPEITEMTENLVMEGIVGKPEITETAGSQGNPETLEIPGIPGITAEITKMAVIREIHVLHVIPMTTETERVVMPIKRMISTRRIHAIMEDLMAEKTVPVLKQGMTLEMNLEMKAEMIGLAEVGAEVQNYLTREVGEQEGLKLTVIAVVAITMTAGNHEVATLTGIAMTIESKQGIHPLKEDMEKEIGVTTEREIKDQAHQSGTKEEVMTLNVMIGERSEGDKREDVREERSTRDVHEERKSKKRHRNESSPSPRQSPKRRREHSPDSDAYNSGDDKNEKHRLLSQVVRPQESRSLSPSHLTEDRQSRWKEEERKSERKESSRRYEEPEFKERVSSGDKQREQREQTEVAESSRARVQENLGHRPSEERDASDRMHEENKKKSKVQKKATKKKKDDDNGVERYCEPAAEESQVFSPKKGQKKKNVEKKRKRSKGDSEVSDEEIVPHPKKKKGPRTPPVTTKEEMAEAAPEKAVAGEPAPKREETTFSDWSDEDVPERGEIIVPERSTEESHRKSHRIRGEKIETPHVTIEDAPHRKPVDQKRSSSLGSNRSHTSSRLRSPSNESAHRSGDDQTGRKRVLHSNSRDRDREREKKSLEITGERKSRIDQLKRGEPSRSTSSESTKHSEPKLDRDHEKEFDGTCRDTATSEKERTEKDLGALQGFEDGNEAEKGESVEEDETKIDDVHSLVSGAGEYEPISDDELDEILAGDAEKREDQQEDEKMPDPVDVIDVDWSSLMPKQPKEPREPGAALLKFTPGAVMLRVGISKRLAGPELFTKIKETCQRVLEKPKDTENLFEHELGALNMAALVRKEERAGLLSNLGPCCKALCFRRDSAIRRQLVKNEKGTTKQTYTNPPVMDSDLLRLSLRLFKRKTVCQGPGQEKTEENKLPQPSIQQEVCVS